VLKGIKLANVEINEPGSRKVKLTSELLHYAHRIEDCLKEDLETKILSRSTSLNDEDSIEQMDLETKPERSWLDTFMSSFGKEDITELGDSEDSSESDESSIEDEVPLIYTIEDSLIRGVENVERAISIECVLLQTSTAPVGIAVYTSISDCATEVRGLATNAGVFISAQTVVLCGGVCNLGASVCLLSVDIGHAAVSKYETVIDYITVDNINKLGEEIMDGAVELEREISDKLNNNEDSLLHDLIQLPEEDEVVENDVIYHFLSRPGDLRVDNPEEDEEVKIKKDEFLLSCRDMMNIELNPTQGLLGAFVHEFFRYEADDILCHENQQIYGGSPYSEIYDKIKIVMKVPESYENYITQFKDITIVNISTAEPEEVEDDDGELPYGREADEHEKMKWESLDLYQDVRSHTNSGGRVTVNPQTFREYECTTLSVRRMWGLTHYNIAKEVVSCLVNRRSFKLDNVLEYKLKTHKTYYSTELFSHLHGPKIFMRGKSAALARNSIEASVKTSTFINMNSTMEYYKGHDIRSGTANALYFVREYNMWRDCGTASHFR